MGLGGDYPLSQTEPRRPTGQVMRHHLGGEPGSVSGDQRHQLVAGVGPSWGIAQVEALLDELGQAKVPSQGGRKEQPSIGHQAVVIKGRAIAFSKTMGVGEPDSVPAQRQPPSIFAGHDVFNLSNRKFRRWLLPPNENAIALSSKAICTRSGWLRDSIYSVLLVWGRFCVAETIIPETQEHFLTPSARRDSHRSYRLAGADGRGDAGGSGEVLVL